MRRMLPGATPLGAVPRLVLISLGLTTLQFASAAPAASAGVREAQFNGELNYETLKGHAASGRAVRVTYSPGGAGAAGMQMAKIKKLVIDGPCHSACAWAFIQNADACFTRRAIFGFHGAADPGTGRPMLAATNYWLSHVRASLRGRISPVLESLRLVYVSASEMARHYPERACDATPAVVASADPARPAPHKRQQTINQQTANKKTVNKTAANPGAPLVAALVVPPVPFALPTAEQINLALRPSNDAIATSWSVPTLATPMQLFEALSAAGLVPATLAIGAQAEHNKEASLKTPDGAAFDESADASPRLESLSRLAVALRSPIDPEHLVTALKGAASVN